MIVVIVFHPSFGAFVKSSHLATSNPTHPNYVPPANHYLLNFLAGSSVACVGALMVCRFPILRSYLE